MKKPVWFIFFLLVSIALTGLLIPDRAEASELVLTFPNGGETLVKGKSVNITWEGYPKTEFTLYLSTNSGKTYDIMLGSGTGGTFTWFISEKIPSTSQARVKIKGAVGYSTDKGAFMLQPLYAEDESDKDFIITSLTWHSPKPIDLKEPFELKEPIETDPDQADDTIDLKEPVKPEAPEEPLLSIPPAPSKLNATALSESEILLTWVSHAENEEGFLIERDGAAVAKVRAGLETFTDSGLTAETTYVYQVRAFNAQGFSNHSNQAAATTHAAEREPILPPTPLPVPTPLPPPVELTIILFYINSTEYFVNGIPGEMATVPVIHQGRTMLPIRYVAEALGAYVVWDSEERKVTIILDNNTVEVWIGSNQGRVNGVYQYIDETNHDIVPFIAPPGFTMLPLRFIAENLGCGVVWNPENREVKITYPDH